MNDDIAGEVHRKFYGKSDKINAHENQNPELQAGHSAGVGSLGFDARKVIEEELSLRHEVGDDFCDGMMEWGAWLWAERCQMAMAGSRKRKGR